MTELENNVPVEQTPQEPQLSDIEVRAVDMGWRPKEEFNGSEDDFIDAKEFVRRKPLFDKIELQNKQIKAVTKALEEFKGHYSKVQETEFKRALASLKSERKQALLDNDADKFDNVDEQIKSVEKQVEQIQHVANQPVVAENTHPAFENWKSRNGWYDSIPYMRKFADDAGLKLHAEGLEPSVVLKKVEEAVHKEFPNKFVNPNKANAPSVNSSSGRSNNADVFNLNETERTIMQTLVKSGVMTEQQYIADLKKVKELK